MGDFLKIVLVTLVISLTVYEVCCISENATPATPIETTTTGFFSKIKSSVKSAAQSIARPFHSQPTPNTNQNAERNNQFAQNISPNRASQGRRNEPDFPSNPTFVTHLQDPKLISGAALSYPQQHGSYPNNFQTGAHQSKTPTQPSSAPRNVGNPQAVAMKPIQPRDPFPALGLPRDTLPESVSWGGGSAKPSPDSYAARAAAGVTTKPATFSTSSTDNLNRNVNPEHTTEASGITDTELRDFAEILLSKDTNNAFKYVTLNTQSKTSSHSQNDEAPERLLTVSDDAYRIPTIEKLTPLYNNYIINSNENEYVSPQEKIEESDLLDAMIATPIMQATRNLLIEKGKLDRDPKLFKELLKLLWFNMYSRQGGKIGSSGFEHIFLAEIKRGDISGLHNWVYFSEAEKTNQVNYLGYMRKVDLGSKGAILKFHFKLNDLDKPVASMFIGTSPELEMAMYTTCFMFRADRVCPMQLNNKRFIIRTYSYRYRGKNMIGSAFPEI